MISIFLTPNFSNYFEKLSFTAATMSSVIDRNYHGLLLFRILILFKYLKLLITLNNQSRGGQFLPVNLRNLSHVSNVVCLLLFSTNFSLKIRLFIYFENKFYSRHLCPNSFWIRWSGNLQAASFFKIAPFLDLPFALKLCDL